MSTNTFSVFTSIFGFTVAAISLLAFLVNICRHYLPSNRIKELESLMDETETFFKRAVEDGLLMEPESIRQTGRSLSALRTRTYRLQSCAYSATTLYQDCLLLLQGTSGSIGSACRDLKRIRAQVIRSSERGRQRLMAKKSLTHSSPSSAPSLIHGPDLSSSIEGPRSHSCPPVLCRSRLDNVRRGFPRANPYHDPTQSDSDARITDTRCGTSIVHTSVTLEPSA